MVEATLRQLGDLYVGTATRASALSGVMVQMLGEWWTRGYRIRTPPPPSEPARSTWPSRVNVPGRDGPAGESDQGRAPAAVNPTADSILALVGQARELSDGRSLSGSPGPNRRQNVPHPSQHWAPG